jgi:hypothetical protein
VRSIQVIWHVSSDGALKKMRFLSSRQIDHERSKPKKNRIKNLKNSPTCWTERLRFSEDMTHTERRKLPQVTLIHGRACLKNMELLFVPIDIVAESKRSAESAMTVSGW